MRDTLSRAFRTRPFPPPPSGSFFSSLLSLRLRGTHPALERAAGITTTTSQTFHFVKHTSSRALLAKAKQTALSRPRESGREEERGVGRVEESGREWRGRESGRERELNFRRENKRHTHTHTHTHECYAHTRTHMSVTHTHAPT